MPVPPAGRKNRTRQRSSFYSESASPASHVASVIHRHDTTPTYPYRERVADDPTLLP